MCRQANPSEGESPLSSYLFKGFRSENKEGMPFSRKGVM